MPGTIVDTGDTAANKMKQKKNISADTEGDLKCWVYADYLVGRWGKS